MRIDTSSDIRIGIITIRPDEYTAVLRQFPNAKPEGDGYREASVNTETGQALTVMVTRCGEQGTPEGQHIATSLIDKYNPDWLLVAGIGGGIPDADFSLGDVVISSCIYDTTLEEVPAGGQKRRFAVKCRDLHPKAQAIIRDLPALAVQELARWHEHLNQQRPTVDTDAVLDQFIAMEEEWKEEWKDKIIGSIRANFKQRNNPLMYVGPIASSDRLVKDPGIVAQFLQNARDIKCVEMESAGIIRACENTPFIAIRGISDIIGMKRQETWTEYACETAAAFAAELILSGTLLAEKTIANAVDNRMPKQLTSSITVDEISNAIVTGVEAEIAPNSPSLQPHSTIRARTIADGAQVTGVRITTQRSRDNHG